MGDRLDVIAELIAKAEYAGEISELKMLHELILEELRMLRGTSDQSENFIKAIRRELQR